MGAVFLGLRKVFDTGNHAVLLSKLTTCNFSPDALKWIDSYFSDHPQTVKSQ